MSAIETLKPNPSVTHFSTSAQQFNVLLQFLTGNVLTALQWEAMLVRALLDLNNNARHLLPSVEKETFPQLKRPEEVISQDCWERIDVNNIENLKTVEQAGKKKGKKKKKSDLGKGKGQKERAEEEARREAEEKERLRRWEECWDKKYQVEEERRQAECCVGRDLCVTPRTQSNIWINVTHDRSIQEIHMSFKHVPVPRPKPPPLPPLKTQKQATIGANAQRTAGQKVDKTTGTQMKKKSGKRT